MIAVDELPGSHNFLSFGLELQEFQHGACATSYEELFIAHAQFARLQVRQSVFRPGADQFQTLATKLRVGSRPGLKAAQTVINLCGGAAEINKPVFFFEDRSECGFGMVLRNWRERFVL